MTDLTETIARLREPESSLVEIRNALPALLDAAERADMLRQRADMALTARDLYTDRAIKAEAERDRLAAENIALSEQSASMKAGRRPFSDAMAERTIALQVKEIDRLAARVAELEAGLRKIGGWDVVICSVLALLESKS